MRRLRAMLDAGIIRRIGAVPNHYAIGWTANGMTVWNVDDDQVDTSGRRLAPRFRHPLLSPPARAAGLALQPVRHGPWCLPRRVFGQGCANSRLARRRLPGDDILYSTKILKNRACASRVDYLPGLDR
jgi:DNA-binding Lrp family transcriptional regulator